MNSEFLANESELKTILHEYKVISSNFLLIDINETNEATLTSKKTIGDVTADAGVYFWLLALDSNRYKIYIGKTTSLKRRLGDYSNPFQIHSPNDYKMKFFQEFILNKYKNAQFQLLFKRSAKESITALETKEINAFNPLINQRKKTSKEIQLKIFNSFQAYYNESFQLITGEPIMIPEYFLTFSDVGSYAVHLYLDKSRLRVKELRAEISDLEKLIDDKTNDIATTITVDDYFFNVSSININTIKKIIKIVLCKTS